jgi:hypothetical protein
MRPNKIHLVDDDKIDAILPVAGSLAALLILLTICVVLPF